MVLLSGFAGGGADGARALVGVQKSRHQPCGNGGAAFWWIFGVGGGGAASGRCASTAAISARPSATSAATVPGSVLVDAGEA